MYKMLLQASAAALGLVTVVLGGVALTGHAELVPYLVGAAIVTVVLLVVLYVGRKNAGN